MLFVFLHANSQRMITFSLFSVNAYILQLRYFFQFLFHFCNFVGVGLGLVVGIGSVLVLFLTLL